MISKIADVIEEVFYKILIPIFFTTLTLLVITFIGILIGISISVM